MTAQHLFLHARHLLFLLQSRTKIMNVKALWLSSASFKLPAIPFRFDFHHSAYHLLRFFHTYFSLASLKLFLGTVTSPSTNPFPFLQ
jgi:hypothetical protein